MVYSFIAAPETLGRALPIMAPSGDPEQRALTTQARRLRQEDQPACKAGLGQTVNSRRVGTTNMTCLLAQVLPVPRGPVAVTGCGQHGLHQGERTPAS